MSLPITVVCGLNRSAAAQTGRALTRSDRHSYLVMHCLDQIHVGLVSRTTSNGIGQVEAELIDLAHGCVSCTLREDVLPTLRMMAGNPDVNHVTLVLPESVEPIGFLESFLFVADQANSSVAEVCHIESVVAVLEPAALVSMLGNRETLADRDLNIDSEDNRGLGDLLIGHIECADEIVALEANHQETSLLQLLNPAATVHTTQPTEIPATFNWAATSARTRPALLDHLAPSCQTDDAWILDWRSHRPLHPIRLYESLQDISDAALRGRGHFQIATRPLSLIEWDSVGRQLRLGPPDDEIEPQGAHLCFVGVSDQRDQLVAALDSAQLTDDELASPASIWSELQDPFAEIWLSEDDQDDTD